MKKQFRSFESAKKFVQKQKIQSSIEWWKYCKSGKRPEDIPYKPQESYKNKGWISWGDFLGTGTLQPRMKRKQFLTYFQCKKFAQDNKIKSQKEWKEFCKSDKKPSNIPVNPWESYDKQWTTWGDFLGTGIIAPQLRAYRKFTDARKFVQSLNLKTRKQWEKYCQSGKKPQNIPADPTHQYKNEWISVGDWLGTGAVAQHRKKSSGVYLSFTDAKKYAQSLGIKSKTEWGVYCKSDSKQDDIPADPAGVYKNDGWAGWGDWFGTGTVASFNKKFWSFKKARKYVHQIGLKNTQDWRRYCSTGKKPDDIPTIAEIYYKNKGWMGMGDWLGTGALSAIEKSKRFLPWSKAKIIYQKIAKENNLKSHRDWQRYVKKHDLPPNLPKEPKDAYSEFRILKRKKL